MRNSNNNNDSQMNKKKQKKNYMRRVSESSVCSTGKPTEINKHKLFIIIRADKFCVSIRFDII